MATAAQVVSASPESGRLWVWAVRLFLVVPFGLLYFFPETPCLPLPISMKLAGMGALAASPLALVLLVWARNPQKLAAALGLTIGIGSAGSCLALLTWLGLEEFRTEPEGYWALFFLASQVALAASAAVALFATRSRFRLLAALAPWLVSALFLGVGCGIPADARTARLPANESSAVGSLRTILTSAVTYETTYQNGFPPNLLVIGPPGDGPPRCDAADLIDNWLAAGEKSGYRFEYTPGPAREAPAAGCARAGVISFVAEARPLTYARTGCRSFWMNEQGAIHSTRKDRPASVTDPVLQ